MKRIWHRILLMLLAMLACFIHTLSPIQAESVSEGLALKQTGTPEVYFAYDDAPLLSFGGMSDFIFYAAPDAFDYQLWTDWAAAHGMNHLRAYPPFSWKYIETFAKENGGSAENLLFPYEETSPGSRQFDLTKFDEAYWRRFREQCEYLHEKGIVVHLLMMNGWQLRTEEKNWGGHFFNPDNNINAFTDHLKGDRLGFYQSVSNRQTGLVEAQQQWLRKIVETTADLDNVYYDLVHEMAENYEDWSKSKDWIEVMAGTVRDRFSELQPNRPIILGMDTGGLERNQREWIFSRPYFDVLVYGKSHRVKLAKDWRIEYKKPYIPQEMWDENDDKYGYREPSLSVHMRKYLWKFMMAKCQQMDFYIKPRIDEQLPGFDHNYDPNGWNPFEDQAVVLRQTWDRLSDYPNLWFDGTVRSGPGENRYVLSSRREGLVYLSSQTGEKEVAYPAQTLQLKELALQNGAYTAEIISPEQGSVSTMSVTVNRRQASLDLPAFVDDLAIHLFRSGSAALQNTDVQNADDPGAGVQIKAIALIATLAVGLSVLLLGVFFIRRKKGA
ncbi:MAG: hypothetical protein WBD47_09955 [Phormidesmis sp.]